MCWKASRSTTSSSKIRISASNSSVLARSSSRSGSATSSSRSSATTAIIAAHRSSTSIVARVHRTRSVAILCPAKQRGRRYPSLVARRHRDRHRRTPTSTSSPVRRWCCNPWVSATNRRSLKDKRVRQASSRDRPQDDRRHALQGGGPGRQHPVPRRLGTDGRGQSIRLQPGHGEGAAGGSRLGRRVDARYLGLLHRPVHRSVAGRLPAVPRRRRDQDERPAGRLGQPRSRLQRRELRAAVPGQLAWTRPRRRLHLLPQQERVQHSSTAIRRSTNSSTPGATPSIRRSGPRSTASSRSQLTDLSFWLSLWTPLRYWSVTKTVSGVNGKHGHTRSPHPVLHASGDVDEGVTGEVGRRETGVAS